MTKTSHRCLALLLLTTTFMLNGCWSAHELTDQYIVLGVSIDKAGENIHLTLQAIRPEKATATDSSDSQSGQASSFFLLTGEGRTIDEARNDISERAPRIVYGGHNLVYFFGEEVAKEGLSPYLDYFARNHLSQESAWIVLARNRGEDMLAVNNILSQTSATGLIDLVKTKELVIPTLHEVLLGFHRDSGNQVITSAEIVPNDAALEDYQMDQLLLQENALLRGDKLVGFLDKEETDTYDWLKNGFRNVPFVLEQSPDCPERPIGIRLKGKPAKFKVTESEARPQLEVKIDVDFSLVELTCTEMRTDPETMAGLEKVLNEQLAQRTLALIESTQRAQLDVFGFADNLHAHQPALWQEVNSNWPEVYASLPLKISVTSHLRNTSILLENAGPKK